MKTLVMITLLIASSNMAQAAQYVCHDIQGAYPNATIALTGTVDGILAQSDDKDLQDSLGDGVLKFDATYKPRANHTGSHRYSGVNECGSFAFIIDSDMSNGLNGHATIQQDCDSDGTGPSYVNFNCTRN